MKEEISAHLDIICKGNCNFWKWRYVLFTASFEVSSPFSKVVVPLTHDVKNILCHGKSPCLTLTLTLRPPFTVTRVLLRKGSLGYKFKDFGQQGFAGEKHLRVSVTYLVHSCEKHLVGTEKPFWFRHFLLGFVCFFMNPTESCRSKISFQVGIEGGCSLQVTLDFYALAIKSFTN